jgi:hypothetical protein
MPDQQKPLDDFSFAYVDGAREALTQAEVGQLFALLNKEELPNNEKKF